MRIVIQFSPDEYDSLSHVAEESGTTIEQYVRHDDFQSILMESTPPSKPLPATSSLNTRIGVVQHNALRYRCVRMSI